MTDATTILSILPAPEHGNGVAKMRAAFERFCLTARRGRAGADAAGRQKIRCPSHGRSLERAGRGWGTASVAT